MCQDADVESVDEQKDSSAGVVASDSDVVQPRAVAQGHHARLVDAVASDANAVADAQRRGLWLGLGARIPGRPRRHATARAMRSDVVVVGDEPIDVRLQLLDGVCRRLFGQ